MGAGAEDKTTSSSIERQRKSCPFASMQCAAGSDGHYHLEQQTHMLTR